MRELAGSFLKYELGDGKTARFWWDKWLGDFTLNSKLGEIGPSLLGIRSNAVVSDAVMGNRWRIRPRCGRLAGPITEAILAIPPLAPEYGPDKPLWKQSEGEYRPVFSALHTWIMIRSKRAPVQWAKLIWFTQQVPRCSFITWLAIRDRLSTGVRMRSWGLIQSCVFCGERDESRDHLFFACPYSFTVWLELSAGLLGSRATPDWSDTIDLLRGTTSRLDSILLRLSFQVTIYHIWRERNGRRHQRQPMTAAILSRNIERMIRNRISSLNYHGDHRLEGLLRRWFGTRTGQG